jgi:hypothetical protein
MIQQNCHTKNLMQASQRTINEQLNNSAPVNEHFSLQTTTFEMCLEIRMSGEVCKKKAKGRNKAH